MNPSYLFLAQRLTALIMIPLVIGHLIMMIIAVQNGLTEHEILDRSRNNLYFFSFYALFVVSASIHAAIGIRNVLQEHVLISAAVRNGIALFISLSLMALGLRSVWGLVWG